MKEIEVSGVVRRHLGRGSKLGFPTANITLRKNIPEGLYAGNVRICAARTSRPALIFIGAAKTFAEKQKQCEIYILNFKRNLYGKKLKAVILKKMRGNKKFSSADALVRQMRKDVKNAEKYFQI